MWCVCVCVHVLFGKLRKKKPSQVKKRWIDIARSNAEAIGVSDRHWCKNQEGGGGGAGGLGEHVPRPSPPHYKTSS